MSHSEEIRRSPLEVVSEVNESSWERQRNKVNEWVYAPLMVVLGDWRGRVGLALILMYACMGTLGVVFVEPPVYGQAQRGLSLLEDPQFPFGTGPSGIGLFAQIVHSTPAMLQMVLGGALFSTGVATVVGLASGYKGGRLDRVMMTITDIAMTLPGLPLVIILASIFEPRQPFLIGVILSINAWAGLARTLRSQALSLREESYIEASRLMGVRLHSIVAKDILPNVMPYIAVNFMNAGRNVIFSAVGLYYLGILPYRRENWGTLLNTAFQSGSIWDLQVAYLFYIPLATIILFSLGLILLSQSMDAVFNPRIRARQARRATNAREVDL